MNLGPDSDEIPDRSFEARLRQEAREMTSVALDRRILEAVCEEMQRIPRQGPRSRTRAYAFAALALLAASVLGAVFASSRSGSPPPDPESAGRSLSIAQAVPAPASRDDLLREELAPPAPVQALGFGAASDAQDEGFLHPERDADDAPDTVWLSGLPMPVNAAQTFAEISRVYELEIVGRSKDSPGQPDAVVAKVVTVFAGPPEELGQDVVVLFNHGMASFGEGQWERRSFLCSGELWLGQELPEHTTMVMPLRPAQRERDPRGRLRLRNAFSLGSNGTLLYRDPDAVPEVADGSSALLERLLQTLERGPDAARRSAMGALRAWNSTGYGADEAPAPELWDDPGTRQRILLRVHDADPKVRWLLSWMIPEGIGAEGLDAHLQLLLDEDPLVRQPALYHLQRRGFGELLGGLEAARDYPLEEALSTAHESAYADRRRTPEQTRKMLLEGNQWETRSGVAWSLCSEGPLDDETAKALVKALEDPDANVRRAAAFVLVHAEPFVDEALLGVLREDEGIVQVAAARSLAFHGEPLGFALLEILARGEDLKTALQAVQFLGELPDGEGRDVVFEATEDPRPLVRLFAVITLAHQKSSKEVRERLQALQEDPEPLVAAAANAACIKVESSSLDGMRLLQEIGYRVDDGH